MDSSDFLKVYTNLPDKLKDQIIVVIDDKPMTWNAVYIEVQNETKLAGRILSKLRDMEVI